MLLNFKPRLDSNLTYSQQVEYATAKAARITTQLSRLMANIGDPLASRRKLLMESEMKYSFMGLKSELLPWKPN